MPRITYEPGTLVREMTAEEMAHDVVQIPAETQFQDAVLRPLEAMKQPERRKDDKGKLRYDLIPVYPLERLAEVYTISANIYDDRNWEDGMAWGRIFRAMLSHALKWWAGEIFDQKDGQHHLSSVAWCAFTLMFYEHYKVGTDNRSEVETRK